MGTTSPSLSTLVPLMSYAAWVLWTARIVHSAAAQVVRMRGILPKKRKWEGRQTKGIGGKQSREYRKGRENERPGTTISLIEDGSTGGVQGLYKHRSCPTGTLPSAEVAGCESGIPVVLSCSRAAMSMQGDMVKLLEAALATPGELAILAPAIRVLSLDPR
ncbi:hypothetical protein BDV12DRAFT_91865 [Aspergillus spectabilis]